MALLECQTEAELFAVDGRSSRSGGSGRVLTLRVAVVFEANERRLPGVPRLFGGAVSPHGTLARDCVAVAVYLPSPGERWPVEPHNLQLERRLGTAYTEPKWPKLVCRPSFARGSELAHAWWLGT